MQINGFLKTGRIGVGVVVFLLLCEEVVGLILCGVCSS
jgi:hypothetical protein